MLDQDSVDAAWSNPDCPESQNRLAVLLRRYRETEGPRARGGLFALAGFDFQLRVFLADFVEALAASSAIPEAAGRFGHSLEGLADYTRYAGVIVQAKRTLTASKLAAAGVELARLDRFLEEEGAGGLFSYEVVARRTKGTVSWRDARRLGPFGDAPAELGVRFDHLLVV